LVYHHDCPKCEEAINEFIEKKTENLACVEVPPYGKKQFHEKINEMKLNKTKQWYVVTPLVLTVENKKIIKANTIQ
jgi:hypothetical protein